MVVPKMSVGPRGTSWGSLGDLLKTFEDLWGPLWTSGDLWGPLGTSGDLWGPGLRAGPRARADVLDREGSVAQDRRLA
eukprot:5561024-Heterocapsa_arctica.AAC.1